MSYGAPTSNTPTLPAELPYHSTPPLPPKPSAENSGHATPATGPPLPPAPYQHQYGSGGSAQSSDPVALLTNPSYAPPQPNLIPPPQGPWLPSSLTEKSTAELSSVLSNRELQAAFLQNPSTTHAALPSSTAHLQTLLGQNQALAQALVELEKTVRGKREAAQSRLLSLRALEQAHRTKMQECEDALRPFSPPATYQRLVSGIAEAESLLTGIEDSFLDEPSSQTMAEGEVGDWLKRVRRQKELVVLRRERRGRWDEGRVAGWR